MNNLLYGFLIKDNFGNEIILDNLIKLNQSLIHMTKNFLKGIVENDSIFIKEIKKEEFISYRNELGIRVKSPEGVLKDYQIDDELVNFVIKQSLLNKQNEDLFLPFYVKKIKVIKYFFEDINYELQVSIHIKNGREDIDV